MKIPGTLTVTTPTDREIVMTRVFDAPRRLVFEALTNPELLRRWFNGPPGWTLVFCEFDAQVGGKYRYVWRNPEGVEMGMGGVNLEIVPPERIVATKYDNDLFGYLGFPATPVRTRPLCAYPATARWDGKGSTDEAASFACVAAK